MQVGVAAGLHGSRCVARHVLPSQEADSRAPAAPSYARPGLEQSNERERVARVLSSERFVDRSPAEVFATLLDEKTYLCSERTMYRSWPSASRCASAAINSSIRSTRSPNSWPRHRTRCGRWDITKLLGPKKWTYYYLYVLLDIYSRYAVGWMVADRENSALAGRLIEETCTKQGVEPEVLTLHSDRGSPMTSKCTAQLLGDLGVTRSLSRPQVSDDNPFSEAQFKTLKYHPGFPRRFTDIDHATATADRSSRGTTPSIAMAASRC